MLQLSIDGSDNFFDEAKQEFITIKPQILKLEHSLLSISKWESRNKVSFFNRGCKTVPELINYIVCMTINSNVDPLVYQCLRIDQLEEVKKYMDDPMTATTIQDLSTKRNKKQIITSELVYCWMFMLNIPIECEKWHINRLMMLIRVAQIENNPNRGKNNMSVNDIRARYAAINAERRAKYHTSG